MLQGMSAITTIKVPSRLRDELRSLAKRDNTTQVVVLESLLKERRHRDFIAQAAAQVPDQEYLDDLAVWDQADLTGPTA
jgi:predicted transcriptional regulator